MQLKGFLTKNVVTIQPDASIDEAIRLMEQHKVRHLPVARENTPVGMVSIGDVLVHVGGLLSEDRSSTRDATVDYAGPINVEQIMTHDVVALAPEDSAAEACRVMLEREIAGVIIVSDGKINGIVTEADFLKRFFDDSSLLPGACRQLRVADHMSTDLITTTPTEGAFALIRKMAKRIHHLPVVADGELVGVVSEHDVRRALALDDVETIKEAAQGIRLMGNFDAGKIMSSKVETTAPDATLSEVAEQMLNHKVGSLPVVQRGELVGIITDTDLLQACAAALESC